MRELAATGVKVAITELDIDVLPAPNYSTSADVNRREEMKAALNPYADGLPIEEKLAKRYADLFAVFLKQKDVANRAHEPTPAFKAVIKEAKR
jgi:endo-1,4-beta-xylanase